MFIKVIRDIPTILNPIINIVSEKKYRNLFCLIWANINDRTATNVKRKPISDTLMKNARKSPYFNAGMDRAYRL